MCCFAYLLFAFKRETDGYGTRAVSDGHIINALHIDIFILDMDRSPVSDLSYPNSSPSSKTSFFQLQLRCLFLFLQTNILFTHTHLPWQCKHGSKLHAYIHACLPLSCGASDSSHTKRKEVLHTFLVQVDHAVCWYALYAMCLMYM